MLDGCQRIGDGEFTIVVSVNADRNIESRTRGINGFGNLFRKTATIRVTQNNDRRADLLRRL